MTHAHHINSTIFFQVKMNLEIGSKLTFEYIEGYRRSSSHSFYKESYEIIIRNKKNLLFEIIENQGILEKSCKIFGHKNFSCERIFSSTIRIRVFGNFLGFLVTYGLRQWRRVHQWRLGESLEAPFPHKFLLKFTHKCTIFCYLTNNNKNSQADSDAHVIWVTFLEIDKNLSKMPYLREVWKMKYRI